MLLQHEEQTAQDAHGEEEIQHELDELDQELHEELGVDHHGDEHTGGLLMDTYLWVLLPFLAVVLIFWRAGVHKTIAGMLDKRGTGIAAELEQARAMREEAQQLLATYQRRQREAEEEAQGIIDQAKRDAKRMGEETRQKLEEQLARRTKAAEEKITRAEAQAIAEVRNRTADVAIAAAEKIVRERLDTQAGNALVDRDISQVRTRLN